MSTNPLKTIGKKSIADLKNTILSPSLTSLYKVDIPLPGKVIDFMNKMEFNGQKIKVDSESISILCSAASLPGSSLMTHEIMNSITPISSLADTLQKNLQLAIEHPNETRLELEDLNAGIKTIKNRSEGLLKFAKTYRSLSKVTHLNLQRIKIEDLFNNIKLLMEPSIKAKNIAIKFNVSVSKLELNIDPHLIEQVLINLILNAVDACKYQENPEIKLLASQNPNRDIVIKVYDNGSGIPQDILENIFVPFFTSKATGSGIGLSLCKQIMLLHKGRIIVKSIEGEGSVFSLVF